VVCAAYSCSNAYVKWKPGVAFLVSEAPDAVSRLVKCMLNWPATDPYSCSLDDQYIQYSTKRGLQRGLLTPQVIELGKGV